SSSSRRSIVVSESGARSGTITDTGRGWNVATADRTPSSRAWSIAVCTTRRCPRGTPSKVPSATARGAVLTSCPRSEPRTTFATARKACCARSVACSSQDRPRPQHVAVGMSDRDQAVVGGQQRHRALLPAHGPDRAAVQGGVGLARGQHAPRQGRHGLGPPAPPPPPPPPPPAPP